MTSMKSNVPIKILIADDAHFMRLVLQDIFNEQASNFTVVATAENGKEAYEKTVAHQPNLVLLDLLMPDFDGIYAIEQIMRHCPTPILLLTALGGGRIQTVFKALEKGAFDFLIKPDYAGGNLRDMTTILLKKVKQVAHVNVEELVRSKGKKNTHQHTFDHLSYRVVVLGASTGGTGAIEAILQRIPVNFPLPIVIAQHMPPSFIDSFAERLNEVTPLPVKVAQEGEYLQGRTVYLLPCHVNTKLVEQEKHLVFRYVAEVFTAYNYPSVDALFLSCACTVGSRAIAILLTGMGKDGTEGMKALHAQQAFTIAQDEASSVIFGMAKEAIAQGAGREVLPLEEIGSYIVGCLS